MAKTGPTPKVVRKGQTTSSKMDHSDEMAAKFVLKKPDQHQQGGCIRGWATREEEAAASQVFFHTPRFEDGFRGGRRHRASRPPSPTRTRFRQKISRRPKKATRRRRSRPTEVTDLDNKKRNKKRSEGGGAERHRPRRRPRAREKNGEVENTVVNTND